MPSINSLKKQVHNTQPKYCLLEQTNFALVILGTFHNRNKSLPRPLCKQKAEQRIRFIYLITERTPDTIEIYSNFTSWRPERAPTAPPGGLVPNLQYISNEMKRNGRLLPTAFIYKQSSYFKGPSQLRPAPDPDLSIIPHTAKCF